MCASACATAYGVELENEVIVWTKTEEPWTRTLIPQEALADEEPKYLRRQKPVEIKRRKFGRKAWTMYLPRHVVERDRARRGRSVLRAAAITCCVRPKWR